MKTCLYLTQSHHTSPRSWSTGHRTPCTGPWGPADLWTFVCSCTVGRELFYVGQLQVTLLIRQLEDITKLFSLMLKAMFKNKLYFCCKILTAMEITWEYMRYVRMCVFCFFTALCFTMAGRGEGLGGITLVPPTGFLIGVLSCLSKLLVNVWTTEPAIKKHLCKLINNVRLNYF